MQPHTVYFAHITDTHFGPTRDYARHGFSAYPCAEQLVSILNGLAVRPDFVIHTGDVVTEPDDRSYGLAEQVFAQLELPVYYVTGNHDRSADIRRWLPMAPHQDLSGDTGLLTYAFEVKGQRFLVLDARAPDELDPHGRLTDAQLAILDAELALEGMPLTVFCHFPPLPMGIPWLDETMLIVNGAELHRRLVAVGPRLQGVFFGHIHQPLTFHRDGVLYSAAPSAFAQLGGLPDDTRPRVDTLSPPGYQMVRVGGGQVVVRVGAFERG